MLKKIQALLNISAETHSTDQSKIHDKSQLTAIALLIELSRADSTISSEETTAILGIAKNTFKLSDDTAKQLYDAAFENNQQAISLYEYTDSINKEFDKKEKKQLIRYMWDVAYADKIIDRYEDHTIRKIADLIYVSHAEFMQAKHAAKKDLSI